MNYTGKPLHLVEETEGFYFVRDNDGLNCGYYQLSELPEWVFEDLTRQEAKMAGLTSRNKGKRGEREVVKILQPAIDEIYTHRGLEPPKLERNQMQSNNGGYDIVGLDWMALEVKFQEQLNIKAWWDQTLKQTAPDQVPVLFYRKTHMKWLVKTVVTTLVCGNQVPRTVFMELEEYLEHFKYELFFRLQGIIETIDEQGKRG